MDRDDIIRKAQKLMAFKAGTATEAEIALAADRLASLLREHNLSLTDITPAKARGGITERVFVTDYENDLPGWYIRLLTAIGMAIGCNFMYWPGYGRQVRFIGPAAEVDVAIYFSGVCVVELTAMAANCPHMNVESYLTGIADGIYHRLRAMYSPRIQAASERGLMIVKAKALADYMQEIHPQSPREDTADPTDYSSYMHGRMDADKVALHQALRTNAPG